MAEKRARVNRLARGRGPRGIHHVRAADAGGERETARERFAEADEVGDRERVFAREPASGAAEARVNFIDDQQRAVAIAQAAEQR